MRYTTDIVVLSAVLTILLIVWAWLMAAPPVVPKRLPEPIAILWHPVAPITDWTPHTSTVLR